MPAPDAAVSAFHVDAAVAWSAVAAAPPTLSRAAPTSTPGSGAPSVVGTVGVLDDDRRRVDRRVVVAVLDELETLKRSRSTTPAAR